MYVLGNWKMNGSIELLQSFLQPMRDLQSSLGQSVQIGLAPPAPLLGVLVHEKGFLFGSQDVSEQDEGAFTGETSSALLASLGCDFSLVGHSERRQMFGDTEQRAANKAEKALEAGLKPVFCIGETWQQREARQTWQCLEGQLAPLQAALGDSVADCVIAYEPVWAIGTGKTASPEQAQEVHAWIRQKLGSNNDLPILYGGSVKPDNADELFAQPDIDGGLIGGASLQWESFEAICQAAGRQQQ